MLNYLLSSYKWILLHLLVFRGCLIENDHIGTDLQWEEDSGAMPAEINHGPCQQTDGFLRGYKCDVNVTELLHDVS